MRTGAPGTPGRNDALRIMIIDDHEISRAAICALLRSEGADVVADLNAGRDALAMARALRPAVVIVDVTPAADTGFGIARRLRALRPAPPVVVLTSSTDRTWPPTNGPARSGSCPTCPRPPPARSCAGN